MATRGKEVSYGQIDKVDRISDFPDYILHHILSFMGTKEACRTSILSKKWASVWASVPFLDFQPQRHYFMKGIQDSLDSFVNFIDGIMKRYSQQNLSIKKLKLELQMLDSNLEEFIDRWLRIAVLNNLEELNLSFLSRDSPKYELPVILFFSKSLRSLECCNVKLPYYRIMKLISLQTLKLDTVIANEDMLQHIISSCPLIVVELRACLGLANISIPCLSNIERLIVDSVGTANNLIIDQVANANLNIDQETGSLRTFDYTGDMWTCKINTSTLRNLKELRIYYADIADEVFAHLLTELILVDTLFLDQCETPRNLNISSNRLEKLHLLSCDLLENAIIDAPNLTFFSYSGHQEVSLCFANIQPQCDAYFEISVNSTDPSWFVNLNKFLAKSNICKVLNLVLCSHITMSEQNVDKLRKILDGPSYNLRELKLSMHSDLMPTQSLLSTFVDGLFLVCRPVTLSISTCLRLDNMFVKLFVAVLQDKVDSWQHPLRDIQVESVDCPNLAKRGLYNTELNFHMRLIW